MMFVDEASHVLQAPIIADILKELRKYKCAFIAATQLWFDVGDDVRPAVLGNTGTFLLGKLAMGEAKSVAPNIDAKPELLRGLKNVPGSHAQWCCYVRSLTDNAVVVTAPYGVLDDMPKQKAPKGIAPQTDLHSKPYQAHDAQPGTSRREDKGTPEQSVAPEDQAQKSAAPKEAPATDEPLIKPGKKY
jgi:hypothetical protein